MILKPDGESIPISNFFRNSYRWNERIFIGILQLCVIKYDQEHEEFLFKADGQNLYRDHG